MQNEYRITRPGLYTDQDGLVNTDVTIRQGYYIHARNEREARELVWKQLVLDGQWMDADKFYGLHVQLWKRGVVEHELSSGVCES